VAKIIGNNVQEKSSYVDTVSLYVHDEIVDGKKLSEIINLKHENTKYLPGYKLPENVVRSVALYDINLPINSNCITWRSSYTSMLLH